MGPPAQLRTQDASFTHPIQGAIAAWAAHLCLMARPARSDSSTPRTARYRPARTPATTTAGFDECQRAPEPRRRRTCAEGLVRQSTHPRHRGRARPPRSLASRSLPVVQTVAGRAPKRALATTLSRRICDGEPSADGPEPVPRGSPGGHRPGPWRADLKARAWALWGRRPDLEIAGERW